MAPSQLSTELSRLIRERAANRCEYCHLPQSCQEATFHIDHIHPRKAGGETRLENLALAYVTCSLKKAARTHVMDSESGESVSIFNPRTQVWDDHFSWTIDWHVQGLTPCGGGTADTLGMNRPAAISIQTLLAEFGRFPDNIAHEGHG